MNFIDEVITEFSQLPGIGRKSAARITYHLLKQSKTQTRHLADLLLVLHDKVHSCPLCGAFTDSNICSICSDANRDKNVICVVEQPQDVQTIVSLTDYNGFFHVLGGAIAPLEGIGPDQLKIASLVKKISSGGISELILATNHTLEGDTTALYIQKILEDHPVKITRLASGLPVGGDIEYADKLTLLQSFKGRISF